ncbi:uncharacterized protein LOC129614879 [Condylostylus longicornis]|uniref:uncharacterized protein LOC129614879 n=1 Tax=Condylostylus longicornis TaxID=2530218 RepID=UPI00244DFFB0|nr:uncharacterized protein LOC129614879 [Condylostylus longicornis]
MLVKLIKRCFEISCFPESVKRAIVTPVHKGGAKNNFSNYRPIAALLALSKAFGMMAKNRLTYFLRNNGLHREQYGFETKLSTTAACLSLADFISINSDSSKCVACVFLDIGFNSFALTDGSSMCESGKVAVYRRKGVPRGSILGSDSLKTYTNDIGKLNLKGSIQLYVGDAVLKYAVTNKANFKDAIEDLLTVDN